MDEVFDALGACLIGVLYVWIITLPKIVPKNRILTPNQVQMAAVVRFGISVLCGVVLCLTLFFHFLAHKVWFAAELVGIVIGMSTRKTFRRFFKGEFRRKKEPC